MKKWQWYKAAQPEYNSSNFQKLKPAWRTSHTRTNISTNFLIQLLAKTSLTNLIQKNCLILYLLL